MSNTKWILGKSIDSRLDTDLSVSDKFSGYLVRLEYPRCIIAVGDIGLGDENLFNLDEDAGWRYVNHNADFELTILEWLDPIVEISSTDVQHTLYEAATHYVLSTQDEMSATEVDAQE